LDERTAFKQRKHLLHSSTQSEAGDNQKIAATQRGRQPRIVLLRESASLRSKFVCGPMGVEKRSVRNIRGVTHALHPRWLRGIVNHRRKHVKNLPEKQNHKPTKSCRVH